MSYKGIIFDLDGTLLDSIKDITQAMNQVLRGYELPELSEERCKRVVGNGVDHLVSAVIPEDRREKSFISEFMKKFREAYDLAWPRNSNPFPGIPELITELRYRRINLAVLSNKLQLLTQDMIHHYLDTKAFSFMYGAVKGIPLKPNPTRVLAIAEQWGLRPWSVLMVGDSKIDMQTAVQARMTGVGVTWGFRDKSELEANGADFIIHKPKQLLKILEESI